MKSILKSLMFTACGLCGMFMVYYFGIVELSLFGLMGGVCTTIGSTLLLFEKQIK